MTQPIFYNETMLVSIPFAKNVSNEPICTFVSSLKKNDSDQTDEQPYSFTEKEITLSLVEFNNYVKQFNFSYKKIKALKDVRRRYKHCIYARRSRLKRKLANHNIDVQNIDILENFDYMPDLSNYIGSL